VSSEVELPGAEPVVTDNPQRERFELRIDGALVGVADYHRDVDTITFTHTEVDSELRGRGLAAVLVGAALEASAQAGLNVEPVCSYVRDFINHRNSQQRSSVEPDS
jgi:predicted GNAT family acetyltransferase